MGDAAAARIAAHGRGGETRGLSLAPTRHSLALSPSLGTQQEAAAGEVTSKTAGVCGRRERAEQSRK